jgi:hypothetical protein
MAAMTFTIPDAVLSRVLDGFAKRNGFTGKAPDGSVESKAQFLKRLVGQFVKDAVVAQESLDASAVAGDAAEAAAKAGIVIT